MSGGFASKVSYAASSLCNREKRVCPDLNLCYLQSLLLRVRF